jgi:peptidoglycan/xylan/chitin deacetylase (PgdA/CDA1 family)
MALRDHIKNLKKSLIQRLSAGRFVFRFPDRSSLFLTFDDGPHPDHTPALLDILRRHDIRATFFLVGKNAARYPEVVRRIEAEGHTIGLHTHTHKTLDRMTHPEFDEEIALNQEAIHGAIQRRPILLRPPEGRITLPSLVWAASRGLRVVHYTITSDDWKAPNSVAITGLFARAAVRGGEILSFHDNNPFTLEAIPAIIDRYTHSGFRFRTVADAMPSAVTA